MFNWTSYVKWSLRIIQRRDLSSSLPKASSCSFSVAAACRLHSSTALKMNTLSQVVAPWICHWNYLYAAVGGVMRFISHL